jgi:hypothetical protein
MTPPEVISILASGLPSDPLVNQAPDAAMTVLRRITHDGQIGELLRGIRDDPSAAHCAALSYRHPLGFESILLIDEQPGFRLRLHVWWPDDEPGVEHVHNHRFMLATVVLLGRYDMQIYQPSAAGLQMDEYRERSVPDGKTWHLEHVGLTGLRPLTSVSVGKGSGYALATDVLHRVRVPEGTLCVTLFLTTPAVPARPSDTRVFAAAGTAAPVQSGTRALPLQDYKLRLDTISAELASA